MMGGYCNTQQVDHCPESFQDMLREIMLLAWVFSPLLLTCALLLLWPLIHAARRAKGRRRIIWIAMLTFDGLLAILFLLLAVSFVSIPR